MMKKIMAVMMMKYLVHLCWLHCLLRRIRAAGVDHRLKLASKECFINVEKKLLEFGKLVINYDTRLHINSTLMASCEDISTDTSMRFFHPCPGRRS